MNVKSVSEESVEDEEVKMAVQSNEEVEDEMVKVRQQPTTNGGDDDADDDDNDAPESFSFGSMKTEVQKSQTQAEIARKRFVVSCPPSNAVLTSTD
jgi:hypothetical protein